MQSMAAKRENEPVGTAGVGGAYDLMHDLNMMVKLSIVPSIVESPFNSE